MSTTPILTVDALNIAIDGHKIHTDLSFRLGEQENLTILGPNGAGKSVLLQALMGIIPYSGRIQWKQDIRIGYLPQGFTKQALDTIPLTIHDFFNLTQSPRGTDQIQQALVDFGLESDLDRPVRTLSGGQFQRLVLAWILIDQPDVVVLDEPSTGIDIGGGETLYSMLHALQDTHHLSIILVTHDISVVYAYSTHVLCVGHQHAPCYGKPKEILTPNRLEEVFGMPLKFHTHAAL